ncbi:hypothetical protein Q5424_11140 [Conexibacter sp. JD483]|uniref:hypothetical protein n=1 Tax=unclassified Conexibacter TaxID=2627773 RepID=UPI002724E2CD|nr:MULTISPECIES: hypothetical protein [unclassified Conexibacter]MDO8186334.1 hypothetical protein [Conexibacter sp. CPCC 205706]MDO8197539.1 hypothetical protein [Conexibacter sp. CPCC 205762]MDR9369639.1 hypothetical protein [Conexibacter sp. JD483]
MLLAVLVVAGGVAFLLTQRGSGGDGGGPAAPLPQARETVSSAGDPFAFDPAHEDDYAARAAAGSAHVLYAKSPGGVLATAQRVARLRPLIDQAAQAGAGGVDPATLEAIVFLESAGRPVARAGNDLSGAVGLTQILAETATGLLRMHVDVAASTRLTRRLARVQARPATPARRRQAARLEARRRQVDERYDPRKALAGTVRYLVFARDRLGRDDLAVVSYHMGVGNLEQALAGYGGDRGQVSYARLFFDSSPTRHRSAWDLLASLGDDSSLYYWKVLAARDLMARWRSDPRALERTAELQTQKASSENLMHPPDGGEAFADGDALRAAYAAGRLVRLPRNARQLGLRIDPQMGELGPRLGEPRALYRGLRPPALRMLVELAAGTRRISGDDAPLTITSTVRDQGYQERLARGNAEATHAFSIHTTGWSFDVLRSYANGRQARAFQFMLDRLQALDLITWVREPAAIHVTVAGDADRLLR